MAQEKPKGVIERIFSSVAGLTLILFAFSYFEGIFCFKSIFLWSYLFEVGGFSPFFVLITSLVFALIFRKIYFGLTNTRKKHTTAIMLVLLLIAFIPLLGTHCPGGSYSTQKQVAFNQGCSELSSRYNCSAESVPEVKTSLIYNSKVLSLLDVCREYLNKPLASSKDCVAACSICPHTTQAQN
jgi:hypothetical protein